MPANLRQIAFTVDVECWGQSVLDRNLPILPHAADNVLRLMEIMAERDAKGTFFVLGKFAKRHPQVVQRIAAAGHEIGSHGYGHVEVWRQTPETFRQDLEDSIASLGDASGARPVGYRAPVFSILRRNLWAFDVLAEAGFAYDSSVFPFDGPRYGIGDWPTSPCCVRVAGGQCIAEYPPTVWQAFGRQIPVSGGGYSRLAPGALLRGALARASRQLDRPPVFYCHPYEIDPGEFCRCYPQVDWKRRMHQGLGRRRTAGRLRSLLRRFQAMPMIDCIGDVLALPVIDAQNYAGAIKNDRRGRENTRATVVSA